MNKQDLVNAARNHLKFSIAGTLGISAADYFGSIDIQTSVERCLTHVMSIGYNSNFEEAIDEMKLYRFAGEELSEEQEMGFVTEMRGCQNTFRKEIAAYKKLFFQWDSGIVPEEILKHLKSSTPLVKGYEGA